MVEFNIVEGRNSPEFIQEFIDLYNNLELRVADIIDILDISHSRYRTIKKNLIEDGLIDAHLRDVKPLFITYNKSNDEWRVQKTINCKSIQFLRFKRRDDALKAVKLFDKYGWDKSNCDKIRSEIIYESRTV